MFALQLPAPSLRNKSRFPLPQIGSPHERATKWRRNETNSFPKEHRRGGDGRRRSL